MAVKEEDMQTDENTQNNSVLEEKTSDKNIDEIINQANELEKEEIFQMPQQNNNDEETDKNSDDKKNDCNTNDCKYHEKLKILKNKFIEFIKTNKKRSIILFTSVTICILVIIFSGFEYVAYMKKLHETIDTDNFYTGIYINDIHVGNMTKDEVSSRLKEQEANIRPDINITISCCGESYILKEDMLNFNFNTDNIIDEAYNVGREGTDIKRYKLVKALEENPKYFSVSCSFADNSENIKNFVDDIASKVNIEAKADYVSKFNPNSANMFVYTQGNSGRKLKNDELITKINDALSSASYNINIDATVETIAKPSNEGRASLKEQTVLLSEYSTTSTNTAQADSNMNLALNSINGKTLQPGEVFSFNKCTGNTTNGEGGYLPATAIKDGQYVQEYGGGICQAATTVYGAALRADMKIVARTCHTYPSSYCPIGQDATISYPNCDFKFKNSSEYPIFIKAYMAGKKLTVQIYGYHPTSWDEIQVKSQGNEDRTKATANKEFYKDGALIKTEAIAASSYKVK